MKIDRILYFSFFYGISFILFLNLILLIKSSVSFLENIHAYLTYFILSGIFFGISLTSIKDMKNKEKILIIIISFFIVLFINLYYHMSMWASLYYLLGVLFFVLKDKLFELLPVVFSLLFFSIYFINQNLSNYYIRRYFTSGILQFIDPLLNSYLQTSMENNMRGFIEMQKNVFVSGYEIATQLAYSYTKDPNLLLYLTDYKEEILEQIEKNYNSSLVYVIEDIKERIYNQITDLFSIYSFYIFVLFIFMIYTVLYSHLLVINTIRKLTLYIITQFLKR